MKGYQVLVKWPSGLEIATNVMPGSAFQWPNRGNAPPKGEGPRIIKSMEDACEYARRSLHNRLSPIDLEWPESVTPIKERDVSEEEVTAVINGLSDKPKQE